MGEKEGEGVSFRLQSLVSFMDDDLWLQNQYDNWQRSVSQ